MPTSAHRVVTTIEGFTIRTMIIIFPRDKILMGMHFLKVLGGRTGTLCVVNCGLLDWGGYTPLWVIHYLMLGGGNEYVFSKNRNLGRVHFKVLVGDNKFVFSK